MTDMRTFHERLCHALAPRPDPEAIGVLFAEMLAAFDRLHAERDRLLAEVLSYRLALGGMRPMSITQRLRDEGVLAWGKLPEGGI